MQIEVLNQLTLISSCFAQDPSSPTPHPIAVGVHVPFVQFGIVPVDLTHLHKGKRGRACRLKCYIDLLETYCFNMSKSEDWLRL